MDSVLHAARPLVGIILVAGNYYFWALVWDWLVDKNEHLPLELGKQ